MTTEAGDMKLMGNFRELIDWVAADPDYKPSNDAIKVAALETQYAAGLSAVKDVPIKQGPHKDAANALREAFDPLSAKARRIRNVAKASGASDDTLANMETPLRKVVGERKSEKIKDDPKTPEDESKKQHSASQMSDENRIGNFRAILALLPNVRGYKPNEEELTLPALNAYADELEAKKNATNTTFVPLSQARAKRDQLLYENEDCIVNIALLVKAYVKGALGAGSHLNKNIKGIAFNRRSPA
jgi:hypothetical protein